MLLTYIKRGKITMEHNPLLQFYYLLGCAQDASEAVDNFDLDSTNPESKKQWDILLAEQEKATVALVNYIKENPSLLLEALCSTK